MPKRSNYTLKVSKRKITGAICICAILFSFFPTGILSFVPLLDKFERVLQLIGLMFIVLYFVATARFVRVNKGVCFVFVVFLAELFSTLFADGSLYKVMYEGFRFAGTVWMVVNEGKDVDSKFFDYLKRTLCVMGVLSLLFSMLAHAANTSLFGLESEFPNYAIPTCAVLLIDVHNRKNFEKKLFAVFIVLNAFCMLFIIDSSTSKVGAIVLIGLLLCDRVAKRISPRALVSIFLVAFILVIFFRITNYFSYIIVDVLKESITLHKRTYAWDYAIELIQKSPILGYGYIEKKYQYSIIYKYSGCWFAHPHNELLRIYLLGGIVNVIAVIGLMYYTASVLKKYYEEKSVRILSYALFAMLIMSIVETCFSSYFYLLIGLALNAKVISIKYGEHNSIRTRLENIKAEES